MIQKISDHYLGDQIRRLLKLIATKSAQEMRNQVEYFSTWA